MNTLDISLMRQETEKLVPQHHRYHHPFVTVFHADDYKNRYSVQNLDH